MKDDDAPPRRDTLRIRTLNDLLRTTLSGGRVVMTSGVHALPAETVVAVLKAVVTFDNWSIENDPHGEHDWAAFEVDGKIFNFKVDAYDLEEKFGSPDPADPMVTRLVLTIMLASEY